MIHRPVSSLHSFYNSFCPLNVFRFNSFLRRNDRFCLFKSLQTNIIIFILTISTVIVRLMHTNSTLHRPIKLKVTLDNQTANKHRHHHNNNNLFYERKLVNRIVYANHDFIRSFKYQSLPIIFSFSFLFLRPSHRIDLAI